jgi:hypothetical protein
MLVIFIGYPLTHALLGPLILQKRGKRKLIENYIYFGNILYMENDLRELSLQKDKTATIVVKIITFCKWFIIIDLGLLIATALLDAIYGT